MPALVLVGGQDPQDPLANIAGITKVMPNARVVVVRGAGHGAVDHGCTEQLADTFIAEGNLRGARHPLRGQGAADPVRAQPARDLIAALEL